MVETAIGIEATQIENEAALEVDVRPADHSNQRISKAARGGKTKTIERYGNCI
jgi:hypothetical protein